MTVNNLHFIG